MRMLVVMLAFLGCARSVEAESGQEQAEGAADLASIERSMHGAYEKISPAVVRITYGTHGIARPDQFVAMAIYEWDG